MKKGLICRKEERREAVRENSRLNGLDYLEVGEDRRELTVHFLGKAPVELKPDNVVIEGGRRVRDIKVRGIRIERVDMAELDDTMTVHTDKEGDFSTYTLRVVVRDGDGNLATHPSFDPHYDHVEFNFKVDCPSDLDCKPLPVCPPGPRDEPVINYLAKDYSSFRQLVLDRLALIVPEWRERHVPDLGVALIEIFAYVGDHLSYYQDAVATEAYLDTARRRISVRRHARLVDYTLHEGCNARAWVCVETDSHVELDPSDVYFVTRPGNVDEVVLREEDLLNQPSAPQYQVFEPMTEAKISLYPGEHRIKFYTWGDRECCLPRGAVTATLVGRWIDPAGPEEPVCEAPVIEVRTGRGGKGPNQNSKPTPPVGSSPSQDLHLSVGDVLIFEETVGPKTGSRADADPRHRHPVRLTGLAATRDPLRPELPLTEITWGEEDALPFPLCLSAMGHPPDCETLEDVSVARGNVILVDHGLSVVEDLGTVAAKQAVQECDCTGLVIDTPVLAERFNPSLKRTPLTYRQPLDRGAPASRTLAQDVRQALPSVTLTATPPQGVGEIWTARRDLLGSLAADAHFVVEREDDGLARLRFGDDELGRAPEAGSSFAASYRVGNGPAGNVGAEAIALLITRKQAQSGGVLAIRNPLPAQGGTAAEPIAETKLFAPHAFRQRLERAVTAEDYATIAMREFPTRLQRAKAVTRWNGSWNEILVAIDPLGKEEPDSALLAEVARRLHRYRRIGHNLVVKGARRVPLDIELLVCVKPGYLRGHVKSALLSVLGNRRQADGRLGFFHPDALSFGEGVFLSRLVATAQAVTGVESVQATRLQRLNEDPDHEIENGVLPLGPLEIARLDNDPSVPENGRLQLDVRGGR